MPLADVENEESLTEAPRPKVKLFGRTINLPQSRMMRICCGVGLMAGGVLGFLPVLGFWMVPLGMLFLAYDFPAARRLNRRIVVWWGRRGKK